MEGVNEPDGRAPLQRFTTPFDTEEQTEGMTIRCFNTTL